MALIALQEIKQQLDSLAMGSSEFLILKLRL